MGRVPIGLGNLTRFAASAIFVVAFLLLTFPIGCSDVDGPRRERCTSFAGFYVPAFTEDIGIDSIWNAPVYLAGAVGIGWGVWWVQGRLGR